VRVVTRFEDVAWVLAHTKIFSSSTIDTDTEPYPPIKEADRETCNSYGGTFAAG
jgi:hypothetical protein